MKKYLMKLIVLTFMVMLFLAEVNYEIREGPPGKIDPEDHKHAKGMIMIEGNIFFLMGIIIQDWFRSVRGIFIRDVDRPAAD